MTSIYAMNRKFAFCNLKKSIQQIVSHDLRFRSVNFSGLFLTFGPRVLIVEGADNARFMKCLTPHETSYTSVNELYEKFENLTVGQVYLRPTGTAHTVHAATVAIPTLGDSLSSSVGLVQVLLKMRNQHFSKGHCKKNHRISNPLPGDDVVISGIAGRFPNSDNVKILQHNLMDKTELITDNCSRWKNVHPGVPRWSGKVNNISKFDADFFGIQEQQAELMDPTSRMLLEHAYEAVMDAGINPQQLRGSKTGVFVGSCTIEMENRNIYAVRESNGLGVTGCSRYTLANRISSSLGITGPSLLVDTACSSSLYAVEYAYAAMMNGRCDAVLVCGANLTLIPALSRQFANLGLLSPDARCKVFDENANGYIRSETTAVIFLQKAKHAKRIYANLIYAKTNCDGFKEQGITFPSKKIQCALMKEVYASCGISPLDVNYIEAHGTGTAVGDPEEMAALEEVFLPHRTKPLLVGSVKSNLGHAEPASGLCSIAKVIIAMESGYIPPNLNYETPRKKIRSINDGRIKIVDEPMPFDGGYIGLNSFGFGGANAHVLLKSHAKDKVNGGIPNDDLPRLVVVSGTTMEAVQTLLNDLKSRPVDVEYIRLLHDIYGIDTPGHSFRGFIVLPPRGLSKNPPQSCQRYDKVNRPVWFVFSGIGSDWCDIGRDLMRFPVFSESVRKSDVILKPYGIEIVDSFTNKDSRIVDNILNSFVSITAIQIGLVDLLASIGISPDNVIGHAMGELSCAYADGCLTAEQVILAAYYQGLSCLEVETAGGSMATVRMSYARLKEICSNAIDIVCHDSHDTSTISGPTDTVDDFISKLQAKNIFVEKVAGRNVACHSRYISAVAAKLESHLRKLIPSPKPRTKKWPSTSVPQNKWTLPSAQSCSAKYLTNSLLSPVLFDETSLLIPNNAIIIQIAPRALLNNILSESLSKSVLNIALGINGQDEYVDTMLHDLGKLHSVGLNLQLQYIYPEVQYPVSRGTSMISPLIRWDHSKDWNTNAIGMIVPLPFGERTVKINRSQDDSEYMSGHVIDRRNLIPATAYLTLIWETLALMEGQLFTDLPVAFEDVKFLRATSIPAEGDVSLKLTIQRGTGDFAVVEGDTLVVTGRIRSTANPAEERICRTSSKADSEESDYMSTRDVYKILRLRGYQYTGLFRGIKKSNVTGTTGYISWCNNWVAFMDNMLQMKILATDTRELLVPTAIQKLIIDPELHIEFAQYRGLQVPELLVEVQSDYDAIMSGGIEIRGLQATGIARRQTHGSPVLERSVFVAHRDRGELSLESIIRIAVHIALENQFSSQIRTMELIDPSNSVPAEGVASPVIRRVLDDLPSLQGSIKVVDVNDEFVTNESSRSDKHSPSKQITSEGQALLLVAHGLFASKNNTLLKQIRSRIIANGFLLAIEPLDSDISLAMDRENFDVVLEKLTIQNSLILLRKKHALPNITTMIRISNDEFAWLSELQDALQMQNEKGNNPANRILLYCEGDARSGIEGLINCLRREPGGVHIQGLFIQDTAAPRFSLENSFYSEQLELDLSHNVLGPGNSWGSFRFLTFDSKDPKPVHHASIHQLSRGDLSSLRWMEDFIQPDLLDSPDTVDIYYSSLNFRDIMLATGKLSVEAIAKTSNLDKGAIGIEYSGIVAKTGLRVMGMLGSGALSNICISDPNLQWNVPDNWSLEDAATIPVVYGTCIYALNVSGQMKKGDKVLIHAGSGGVGQAAITLALHEGCEVFTTVGTFEKRKFIKQRFPQIDDNHIGNSRDVSFEQLILRETKGRGVDIVLNSLAEEKLQASVRCLARGGRFLEIGKFDLAANNLIGTGVFLKGIKFHGIHLDHLFNASTKRKQQLKSLLDKGIASGAVKPLVRKVFAKDQTKAAFRYMAAGKHIGKILIKIREEGEAGNGYFDALPRYYCLSGSSYLIHGGLGGFGLELADWLVLRGARKLVLTSRKGISNGYQRRRIHFWQSHGVDTLIIVGEDASTQEGCEAILNQAAAFGPVDAIFNLAVVLRDSLCENQTAEAFRESLSVKSEATKQFDKLSRILCPRLRQFVVFSSVSCGRGNAGQTNYGMANSIMERICESRAAEGLPALAIQWGAIGDVGLVAEMQDNDKELVIGGTLQQSINSCLQELDGFLSQKSTIVSSMVVAEKKSGNSEAVNMVDTVLNIIGLKNLDGVSHHASLAEIGLDSMMAIEIKQTLEREFDVSLAPKDIRNLNFVKLFELSNQQTTTTATNEPETDDTVSPRIDARLKMKTFTADDFSTEICLPMKTQRDDGAEVFLIPGIEGSYTSLQNMCRDLKSPAICLHAVDAFSAQQSVADEADFLLPHVRERISDRKEFVIAGYSYGSLVSIELARRLESEGFTGRLVLIDGTPEVLRQMYARQVLESTDEELQLDILSGLTNMVAPTSTTQICEELSKHGTWDAKLRVFLQSVQPETDFEPSALRRLCETVYNRSKAVANYNVSSYIPIKSPIVLIKATNMSYNLDSEDYGLKSLTLGKRIIHPVEADHVSILLSTACTAAISGDLFEQAENC